MFCTECGQPAGGKFCGACGTRLSPPPLPGPPPLPVGAANWSEEVRYEVLLRAPAVQHRIARHAARAKKGVSGEQLLELYDKLMKPPISTKLLVEVMQPLYARLGIGTGKSRSSVLPFPPGVVIVAALCSLAQNGQTILGVHQHADGCVVEAKLPSDVFALEGELAIEFRRVSGGTRMEAATRIAGQLIDWGKSGRCLERLFAEAEAEAADVDLVEIAA